jgi:hypothetical protein
MGYSTAYDLANMEDLGTGIAAHLRGNCYPPISLDWMEPAKEAIANVVAGHGDALVTCPEWCKYNTVTSHTLVDALRLEAFVDAQLVFDDPEYCDEEDEDELSV